MYTLPFVEGHFPLQRVLESHVRWNREPPNWTVDLDPFFPSCQEAAPVTPGKVKLRLSMESSISNMSQAVGCS